MISFNIQKPDIAIATALQDKIDNLTKPKGSLGTLEEIALQIGLIQQTLSPVLHHPVNVIYASDHGIADEGVSKSPKEVTRQVIHNFLNGGAGICFLSRQHGFEIKIVDGGVDFDFPAIPELIDRKIRKGTRNFLYEAAMTQDEMELAIRYGADIVTDCHDKGSNVISFGEMGIGNTAASSMWMTCLTGIPLVDCVGAGHRRAQTKNKYPNTPTPELQGTQQHVGCNPLFRRLRDGDGCGRHAPRGRIEDGYSGRWLYHDKLRTGCFTLVSGNASLLHIRTLRRRGRTQTCTGYPTSQAVAKSRLTPG